MGPVLEAGADRRRRSTGVPRAALALLLAAGACRRPYAAVDSASAPLAQAAPRATLSDAGPPTAVAAPSAPRPALRATQIAVGYAHACALGADGSVACWGSNAAGQLGDGGPRENGRAPVRVASLANAAQVALGVDHGCARLRDGSVACWGSNAAGQLGDGTTTLHTTPVPVAGLSNVVEIALGSFHSCARLGDGAVRCWGSNQHGELGDGTTDNRARPVAVTGLAGVASIAAGLGHTCARLGDGTAQCWGANAHGELGDGTFDDRHAPTAVRGLARVAEVALGDWHTCARLEDGTMRCWGDRESGQVGDGHRDYPRTQGEINGYEPGSMRGTPTPAPPVPGLRGVAALALGTMTTCARLDDGTVRCWGMMEFEAPVGRGGGGGQMLVPTRVAPLADVRQFVVSTHGGGTMNPSVYACALRGDGAVLCFGDEPEGATGAPPNGTTRPTPLAGLADAADVALGGLHACALMRDGTARCWGANAHGELGDGTMNPRTHATPVRGLADAAQLALATGIGWGYSCARLRDGTVSCWGRRGRLGPGGQLVYDLPPRAVAGVAGAAALVARGDAACALRGDGSALCWRAPESEASPLGFGLAARAVRGLPALAELALGREYACGRTADRRVYCWGRNLSSQLAGASADIESRAPVEATALAGATQIAAGAAHGCALRPDGTVVCWGENLSGQLGDGTVTSSGVPSRAAPVPVVGLAGVTQIALGAQHSCARRSDGSVWCWGANNGGQLGDGTRTTRPTPVAVAGLPGPAARVVAGDNGTCAVLADGSIRCWGGTFRVLTDAAVTPDGMVRVPLDGAS